MELIQLTNYRHAGRGAHKPASRMEVICEQTTKTSSIDTGAPVDSETRDSESVLLTLLFTDIVGSTEMAQRLGDAEWSALLMRHHSIVRQHLAEFRGTEIDTAGDGFFATFDKPGRAVRFAAATRAALQEIGIAIRAGVHAGECDVCAGRVVGIAVHVAARVMQVAQGGEILVSNTVRDLLAGSGLRFIGRQPETLRGLAGPRELFAYGAHDEQR